MIVTGWLGDGYNLDAVLAQFADRKLHVGAVAEESIERIEDDRVEWPIGIAGAFHHLLKGWSAVIRRGGGLDILLDHDPAVGLAMGSGDIPL